jgi:hypothetical protein
MTDLPTDANPVEIHGSIEGDALQLRHGEDPLSQDHVLVAYSDTTVSFVLRDFGFWRLYASHTDINERVVDWLREADRSSFSTALTPEDILVEVRATNTAGGTAVKKIYIKVKPKSIKPDQF